MPAPILPLIEAVTHWPERGALIGLDLGTKTIGVAVSDPTAGWRPASKRSTARRSRRRGTAAGDIGRTQRGRLRAGLPINMDGSEGPRAQSTRAFARNFSNLTGLAIALWDERLSTAPSSAN
jgi:putative Holliday junction resolvase